VHLDTVVPVFELVIVSERLRWKLTFLADGHEADAQLESECPADDEAARFDRGDLLRRCRRVTLGHALDGIAEAGGILEQRRDVAKHHTPPRVVRDGTDEVFYVRHGIATSRLSRAPRDDILRVIARTVGRSNPVAHAKQTN
jgi:hypothetical protein